MQKILITGATGFVGRYLVEALKDKYHIFELNRTKRKTSHEQIIADIRNKLPDLPPDINIIIHCASIVGYSEHYEKKSYCDVNVRSTLQLLEYGRRIKLKKFVYLSTGGIYGFSDNLLGEQSDVNPADFYSLTKYMSELFVNYYRNDFDTQILRIFFPYGPGQKGRFVLNLIQRILDNKPIILNNPLGKPRLNPIYISDLVEYITRMIQTDFTGIVNIAGEDIISVKELVEIIGKCSEKEPIFQLEDKPLLDMVGDVSKISELTNYKPCIGFEEGISKILADCN
jgi:UDP-glucose 4-epimerase